jgi:hypothetical protein
MTERSLNVVLALAAAVLGAIYGHERAARKRPGTKSLTPLSPPPATGPDRARIGYEAAIQLWVNEGNQVWLRFTAMIYANTILLAAIGVIITSSRAKELRLLPLFLGVLGVVLCSVWAAVTRRGYAYFRYWILAARELEERHLNPPVRVVARGARFGAGDELEFLTNPPERHRLGWWGQARIEILSYIIILLFVVVYVATCVTFLATLN